MPTAPTPLPRPTAPGPPRSSARRATAGAAALAALLVAVATACADRSPPPGASPVVDHVVDGDTLVLRFGDRSETVRLLGIDTPETVHPTRPPECFGAEASARLAELLPRGTPVAVERDVEALDAYGRLLLHVHRADGTFVNRELVAGGHATTLVIPPNGAYAAELAAAERQARAAGRGLWGACGGPGAVAAEGAQR